MVFCKLSREDRQLVKAQLAKQLSVDGRAGGRACNWGSYEDLLLSLWPDDLVKTVVAKEVRTLVESLKR
jgi:hypothetical protein